MTAGFLAIWSDVAAAQETDYLHWLTREHTQERLGVPGFLGVRVFRAQLSDVRRYFIHYRLEAVCAALGTIVGRDRVVAARLLENRSGRDHDPDQ